MSEENITMVLAPWTICPECLGVRKHWVSPWTTGFPHKDGCSSKSVVCPNIANEDGVRLSAAALKANAI